MENGGKVKAKSCRWCYFHHLTHHCNDCEKKITPAECRKGEGICEECLTKAGWNE